MQVSAKHLVAESVTRAECRLETTTACVGERFETRLLWKEDKPSLCHSTDMALQRLHQMERRIAKDSNLAEQQEQGCRIRGEGICTETVGRGSSR